MGPVTTKEWTMAALVILAIFLWITGANASITVPFLGSNFINATSVVLVGIALMLATGVVEFNDIISYKAAWDVFLYFATLLTLASGLNTIGFIPWLAKLAAAPLQTVNPIVAMIALVALFYFIHYFFTSLTSQTAAVLPVVLAVGTQIPGIPALPFALLCVYSLGLMGVISPYATGPAPIYFGSGYVNRSDFWKLGFIFGILYFAVLIIVGVPYLMNFTPL
jgi:citrate:succinate antiporter/L-tartrate/succinate antiporter